MILQYLPTVLISIFGLIVLALTFFTVEHQSVEIVQRLGKFARIAGPGLNVKIPFLERVAGELSLRVSEVTITVETKTKDNVFVTIHVSLQYRVKPAMEYEAFYKLEDPVDQMSSFVFDVVRAKVPHMLLDEVFDKKDEVGDEVKRSLDDVMGSFGYEIQRALVVDVEPDATVKVAMNQINAARREREAAEERGNADKILRVKAAEAEAESKELQGKGIAKQRAAIVDGLRESVKHFSQEIPGAGPQDVMSLVLLTQYFDTLKEIGASSKSSTVFIPHSPGQVADLEQQIRNGMLMGRAT